MSIFGTLPFASLELLYEGLFVLGSKYYAVSIRISSFFYRFNAQHK